MINAIEAEEMSLSIWLRSDGLSFAVYPRGANAHTPSVFTEDIAFIDNYTLRENLEQCLYQQPILGLPFARVMIYYYPAGVVLTPQALFDDNAVDVWEHTACRPEESLRAYHLPEDDKVLLGALEREVVEFLERSFLMLSLRPIYADLIGRLTTESQETLRDKLLLYLADRGLTIAHIQPTGITYLNSFDYVRPNDPTSILGEVMYYTSLVWKTLNLNHAVEIVLEQDIRTEQAQAGSLEAIRTALHETFGA